MTHWSPACIRYSRDGDKKISLFFFFFIFGSWEEGQSDGIDTEEAELQCSKPHARRQNPSSGYYTPLSVVVAEHDLDQHEL